MSSRELASLKLTSEELTRGNLRPRRHSERLAASPQLVDKKHHTLKKCKRKTVNLEEAKSQFVHSWLDQQNLNLKVQSSQKSLNVKTLQQRFEIKRAVQSELDGTLSDGEVYIRPSRTLPTTSKGKTMSERDQNSTSSEVSEVEPEPVVSDASNMLTMASVEHNEESVHVSNEVQSGKGKEPEATTKSEQRMETMMQQYRERYEKNDPGVLFEMFEGAFRRILNLQKSMAEMKNAQASLKEQINNVKLNLNTELTKVSGQVLGIEADQGAIDEALKTLTSNVDDVTRSFGVTEAKISAASTKLDRIEADTTKGTMILKNLEENEDEVKEQVYSFFAQKLKISSRLEVITAFRMGKEREDKKPRSIKFKLLDSNDINIIFQHVENLKGVKNENGDRYMIQEFLTEKGTEVRNHYRDLTSENRRLPVSYQTEIMMKAGRIQVDGKDLHPVRAPPHGSAMCLTETQKAAVKPNQLWQGDPVTVESSVFTGYAIETDKFEELKDAYTFLRSQHLDAAHIVCGYRLFGKKFAKLQNYSDDGEIGGGRVILNTLKDLKLFNTAVFVVRVRDHKNIGSKRFQAIEDAACGALSRMEVAFNTGQREVNQELVGVLNTATKKPKNDPKGGNQTSMRGGRHSTQSGRGGKK